MPAPSRLNLRDLDAAALRAAVAPYGVDQVVAGRIFPAFTDTGR